MDNNINATEEKLLATGKWKKENLQLHIAQVDKNMPLGIRSLTYDLGDTFTAENISNLQRCLNEINVRFPMIKVVLSGTGYEEVCEKKLREE